MANSEIRKLKKEFNRSNEARYIHRLHGVLLVLNGVSSVKAARFLNEPQRTVADWVKRFKEGGIDSLGMTETRGRPKTLNGQQELLLKKAIINSPGLSNLEGKRWTGILVSKWLKRQFGIEMTVRNSRNLLRLIQGSNA